MIGIGRSDRRPALLVAIDVLNVAWMAHLGALAFIHRGSAHNYLLEPGVAALLIAAIAAHLARWRALSRTQQIARYTSVSDLSKLFKEVRDEFFGRIPYMVKLMPTEATLVERAKQLLAEGPVEIRKQMDVLRLLLATARLQLVHLVIVLASAIYLCLGELPSFAVSLAGFWPAVAITLVLAAGMLVQSLAVLLFAIIYS